MRVCVCVRDSECEGDGGRVQKERWRRVHAWKR